MSEMIDRVAKAIQDAHPVCDGSHTQTFSTEASILEQRRREARAAIEAMREPTESQRFEYYKLSHKTEVMFDAHWERAIDAALK